MAKYNIKKASLEINSNVKTTPRRMWTNILLITFCFLLTYTSYFGMSSLQSSLHRDSGIGTFTISARYFAYSISSLFLSPVIVRITGHKWALTVSFASFLVWILANGIGKLEALLPAATIHGFFSASLWTAQGAYFCEIAKVLAMEKDLVHVSSYIFGVFMSIYAFSGIISDIINSSILRLDPTGNVTLPTTEEIEQYCGINDCPWIDIGSNTSSTFFKKPSETLVWALVGVYAFFTIIALVFCIFFLDDLRKLVNLPPHGELKQEIISHLLATLKLFKSQKAWLLIPINWFSAVFPYFHSAEYNASWVTCALGIWMIGFVALPRSIINSPLCYFTGVFAKKYGVIIPMAIVYIVSLLLTIGMIFWKINTNQMIIFYLFSVGFGVTESINDVVVQGLFGSLFPDQMVASFAMYNFVYCMISSIMYGYSYYLCSDVKLYIAISLLILSVICYFLLQVQLKRESICKETKSIKKTQNHVSITSCMSEKSL